jgi:predicted transcriptional regulator
MASLKGPVKCRVPNTAQFADWVRLEVRRLMTTLQADGWTAVGIAESVGVSRRSLYRWRNGDESPEVPQFLALCELVDEQRANRKVGS